MPPTDRTLTRAPEHEYDALLNLIRRTPFGIYLVDADFRLVEISAGCEHVFAGIDPLIGRDFSEVLRIVWPEPFASDALARFRHTLATGEPYHSPDTTELRGNVSIVESYDWQLQRLTMPDGRHGVVCYFYETTARVHAEQDARWLADLGERCRTAGDTRSLMRDATRSLGTYLRADRCFITNVHVSENRWTIVDDYHGDGTSIAGEYALSDYDESALASLSRGIVETVTDATTDPRTAPRFATAYEPLGFRANVTVPLLRGGTWVAALVVTSRQARSWQRRELTLLETAAERIWNAMEQRRLEGRLHDEQQLRERALAQSASRAELTKEATGVGFWFCDLPFDKLIWDSQVKEHFWLPADAAVTIETFYAHLHPDDRERTRAAIDASIANHTRYDIEYRTLSATGQVKWIRAIGRTFYDEAGQPIRFDGVTLDITETKLAEDALRENDRRKDEFLAMLAHELRNPLAPIRHAAQVLKLVGSAEPSQQWARDVIERQTQHLTRLVDDLLDVSRITQRKITLQREPLHLATIVERAIEANRPLADTRRQRLTVTLPREPISVEGDLTRLIQVMSNLVNNAVKYTHEGGEIAIDAAANGGSAIVRVRDNGMGIAADLLPSIFDLFRQADQSLDRSQGGLGIGLTLVRLLIEMHGGRVEAHSAGPGRGSEFVVLLPLLEVNDPAAIGPAVARSAEGRRPRRILIVEDNKDSAEMLQFLLALQGHEMRVAEDGAAALEAARVFQPHVILCDLGLPQMNGYQVARHLRAQPEFQQTRLIALSGYGQDSDRRRAKEAGFDYHLVKPVEPDTLTALLDSLQDEPLLNSTPPSSPALDE